MPGIVDLTQHYDLYEETDAIEVAGVYSVGAIYWTFPAEGGRGNGFAESVTDAEAISYTIARQREQVAKLVSWTGYEITGEIALQFDHYLGLDARDRMRLDQFSKEPFDALVIVNHYSLDRWRPNQVLNRMLDGSTVLRIMPPSDMNDHFIWNRHWKKQRQARAKARRDKTRYHPIFKAEVVVDYHAYMTRRISTRPDWSSLSLQQKMDWLRGNGLMTISGLKFDVEHVRDFEESRTRSMVS